MNERDVLSKAKEVYKMESAEVVCNVVSNGLQIILTETVKHTDRVTLTERLVIQYRDPDLNLRKTPTVVSCYESLLVDGQNTGKGANNNSIPMSEDLLKMMQELSTVLHPLFPTPRRFVPRHNEKYFMVVFSSRGLEVEHITFNSKNTVHKWAFLHYKIFNDIRSAIGVCRRIEEEIQQSYIEKLRSVWWILK